MYTPADGRALNNSAVFRGFPYDTNYPDNYGMLGHPTIQSSVNDAVQTTVIEASPFAGPVHAALKWFDVTRDDKRTAVAPPAGDVGPCPRIRRRRQLISR